MTLEQRLLAFVQAVAADVKSALARITTLESAPPGSSAWGGISGTLSNQTDLQNALNAKIGAAGVTFENLNANGDVGGGASQVSRGDHVHPQSELAFVRASVSAQSGTTSLPNNNNAPTTSNGTQIFSQAITLDAASNEVRVEAALQAEVNANNGDYGAVGIAVFRGSTCIGGSMALYNTKDPGEGYGPLAVNIVDAPGSVGPHTYSVRVGSIGSGTWYIARTRTNRWAGRLADGSFVTLQEIKP
jgi:hypothetical protein